MLNNGSEFEKSVSIIYLPQKTFTFEKKVGVCVVKCASLMSSLNRLESVKSKTISLDNRHIH